MTYHPKKPINQIPWASRLHPRCHLLPYFGILRYVALNLSVVDKLFEVAPLLDLGWFRFSFIVFGRCSNFGDPPNNRLHFYEYLP
jgi:hypothetical protein